MQLQCQPSQWQKQWCNESTRNQAKKPFSNVRSICIICLSMVIFVYQSAVMIMLIINIDIQLYCVVLALLLLLLLYSIPMRTNNFWSGSWKHCYSIGHCGNVRWWWQFSGSVRKQQSLKCKFYSIRIIIIVLQMENRKNKQASKHIHIMIK